MNFLIYIYLYIYIYIYGNLSVEHGDKQKSKLVQELNDSNYGKKPDEGKHFFCKKRSGFFLKGREKNRKCFRSNTFPTKDLDQKMS